MAYLSRCCLSVLPILRSVFPDQDEASDAVVQPYTSLMSVCPAYLAQRVPQPERDFGRGRAAVQLAADAQAPDAQRRRRRGPGQHRAQPHRRRAPPHQQPDFQPDQLARLDRHGRLDRYAAVSRCALLHRSACPWSVHVRLSSLPRRCGTRASAGSVCPSSRPSIRMPACLCIAMGRYVRKPSSARLSVCPSVRPSNWAVPPL
jgi:hypothetical protein